jgi:hypothetical protein
MRIPSRSARFVRRRAWLAALVLLCAGSPALAEVCRPSLQVKETNFSPMIELQRTWSAALDVDASACASRTGAFEIRFVRLKENGVDLPFTERFTWQPGRTEVSLDLWADEAILSHAIGDIAPCPCQR